MERLTRGLQLYIFGVIGAGVVAVYLALLAAPPVLSRHDLTLAALLLCLTSFSYLAPVQLAPKRGVILDTALRVVAILTLPAGEAAILIGLGVALGNIYLRRPWFNTLFNAAQAALSIVVAAAVYELLAPVSLVQPARTPMSILAVAPAGVALYLVSHFAVDCAFAIQRRTSPFANWLAAHAPSFLPHKLLVAIGAISATAVSSQPWLILVMVAPVVAVQAIMSAALRFDADAAVIAAEVVDALDLRHPLLAGRSRRMAALAERVARALGPATCDAERVAVAARLHDIAAALTPAPVRPDEDDPEYQRSHGDDGAVYAGRRLRLHDVAEALRLHHEHFDGHDSPHGLGGQDIPLAARVLAVCDTWVSLTTAVSFRPALTVVQAQAVLRGGAGTQWDPSIVDALIGVVSQMPDEHRAKPSLTGPPSYPASVVA